MAHHQGLGSGHVLTKLRTCLPIVVVLLLLSLWNNMQHIAPYFDMTDITSQLCGGDGITYQEMGPNSTIIVNGKKNDVIITKPSKYDDDIDNGLIKERLLHNYTHADMQHPFPHFFVHIPKAGGTYARHRIMQLHNVMPENIALSKKDKVRICDIGTGALHKRQKSFRGINCTMHMSEQPYNNTVMQSYAMVRNPREHVLSQYFHCKESKKHRKSDLMPSLDVWLHHWVLHKYRDTQPYKVTQRDADYACYDPRNLQSRFARFDPKHISEIQQKFTVIGPVDQMDKVLCVMILQYTKWKLPDYCLCNASENTDVKQTSHLNNTRMTHYVKHHGSTYNTSQYQDDSIYQLVEDDMILYEYVTDLFNRQVDIIEEEYNVTLCNKIKL